MKAEEKPIITESKAQSSVNDKKTFAMGMVQSLILPVAVLYMEILAKLKIFGNVFDDKIPYLLLLSPAMGFLLSALSMLLPAKARRVYLRIVLGILGVWFSFHVIYHHNFHTFFSWNNMGQAMDVTQFWREALTAAGGVWYMIAAFFLPLTVLCVAGKRMIPDRIRLNLPCAAVSAALFLGLYLPALTVINSYQGITDQYTPYYYYTYIQSDLDQSFHYYGIVNTTRLDIKQLIFGAPVETIVLDDYYEEVSGSDTDPDGVEYGWNMMDIDFDKAENATGDSQLKSLDAYFKTVQPTRKNRYTGIFKGKNLIFLTLEGFSDKVIDPEFMPVLYRMSTEGFVFRNSYNPMWGGSTATGEYANLTGNFYPNTKCMRISAKTYQPFAMGNQFKKLGYRTLAYHNNSYTFYGRQDSHPNFGYEYKGVRNGLKLAELSWPNSDRDMADATLDEFANLYSPFHVYYMTFSGHANYGFSENAMARKHKNDIPEKYRSYPEDLRGYYASQYEVELMLEALVDRLEREGKLENTVFAMAADHYPYGLSDRSLSILYGLPKDNIRNNAELYRNRFILWSASMTEPVEVDTPCSTIDILPTLSNMFGLEYDSRLMMGTDIMAEGSHMAMLKVNGWSWVSAQGEYSAGDDTFTPAKSCTLTDEEQRDYVARMKKIVRAKTTYSNLIIEKDYYSHIFEFIRQ